MARRRHDDRIGPGYGAAGADEQLLAAWRELTWDDVTSWAGPPSVQRGRRYQRQGRVIDLVRVREAGLLATVAGNQRYVTSVELTSDADGGRAARSKLSSSCSCPVGYDGCKHAVAVVAEFLRVLAEGRDVPEAGADDPRWVELDHGAANDDLGGDLAADVVAVKSGRRRSDDEAIERHLAKMKHDELVRLVVSLTQRYDDLRDELVDRIAAANGDTKRLVREARKELRAATKEPGWRNHWSDEGGLPDYSRLKQLLARLLELRCYDELVELGRELISRGMEQVNMSHDEGETAEQLHDCLPLVFEAARHCSMAGAEKILYAIDACLQDDYDIVSEPAEALLDVAWPERDWSTAADELACRLRALPEPGGDRRFSRDYERDRVSGWLLHALEKAGRRDEMQAIYEDEARLTRSYNRLVNYLLREGKTDEAERWACAGIIATRDDLPGLADGLAKTLAEVAKQRGEWDVVAAQAAAEFFDRPSVERFTELCVAARRANCESLVRAKAMAFLETGKPPVRWERRTRAGKGKSAGKHGGRLPGDLMPSIDADWPLPVPPYLAPGERARTRGTAPQPHLEVLLDMAIQEERPDDALRWFDRMCESKQGRTSWRAGGFGGDSTVKRVAQAVAGTHPQRAIDLYQSLLDAALPHANVNAYIACGNYLRLMRPLFEALGRSSEWEQLVAQIREQYRNRPRFMEVLDEVDSRTIVEAARKSRR